MASEATWITIVLIVKLKGNSLRAFPSKLAIADAEKLGGEIIWQKQLYGLSSESSDAVLAMLADVFLSGVQWAREQHRTGGGVEGLFPSQ